MPGDVEEWSTMRRKRSLPTPTPMSRGDRNKLLRSLTIEEEEAAVVTLRDATYAESSQGPQRSRQATACKLLRQDREEACVTNNDLEMLAARLKEAGYRSGFKYLLEAKRLHVSNGHAWTAQLDLCLTECKRGLERGMGAAKKAGELHLHEVAHLPDETWEGLAGYEGPCRAKRSWLVACFWVMREIEVANVRIKDVDLEGSRVTITLPMSKTDQQAIGFKRTMHCCCSINAFPDGDMKGSSVCAPCAVQKQLMERYLEGAGPEDHLFSTSEGEVVEKKAMVQSWTELARKGGRNKDPGSISGHSARRSGAKMLCRCGWPLWKVQFHARWASQAVKGYTEEVFGEIAQMWRISEKEALAHKQKAGTRGNPESLPCTADLDRLRDQLESLKSAVEKQRAEARPEPVIAAGPPLDSRELAKEVAKIIDCEARFVQNLTGDHKVHKLLNGQGTVDQWKAGCGWTPCLKGRFKMRISLPEDQGLLCRRCFEGDDADAANSVR